MIIYDELGLIFFIIEHVGTERDEVVFFVLDGLIFFSDGINNNVLIVLCVSFLLVVCGRTHGVALVDV